MKLWWIALGIMTECMRRRPQAHSTLIYPLYEIVSNDAHIPNQNMLILRKYANAVGDYQMYWVWVR